jgi:hypothetical protein
MESRKEQCWLGRAMTEEELARLIVAELRRQHEAPGIMAGYFSDDGNLDATTVQLDGHFDFLKAAEAVIKELDARGYEVKWA